MKLTLYMAISIDGHIAKADHSTDWVSDTDWKQFGNYFNNSDAVIMGRKTYEVSEDDFPYGKSLNIVLTQNKALHKENEQTWFTDSSPKEILKVLEKKELSNILLIGGGITNSHFLDNNLIDELVLSVHPIILGTGIKIFENEKFEKNLELTDIKKFDKGLVHLIYKVII